MRQTAFKLIKFTIIVCCLCLILGCALMAAFSRSVANCILNRHYVLINSTNATTFYNFTTPIGSNNTNSTLSNVTYPHSYKTRIETRIVKTFDELNRIRFTYSILVIVGSITCGVIHVTGLMATVKERYCIILGYAMFMTFQTFIAFVLTFKTKYEWIYTVLSGVIAILVCTLAGGIREKHMRIDSNQTTEHYGPKPPEVPIVNVYGINRPPTPHPDHSQSTSTVNNHAFSPAVNNNLVPADNLLSYYQIMPPPVVLPPLSHPPVWRNDG